MYMFHSRTHSWHVSYKNYITFHIVHIVQIGHINKPIVRYCTNKLTRRAIYLQFTYGWLYIEYKIKNIIPAYHVTSLRVIKQKLTTKKLHMFIKSQPTAVPWFNQIVSATAFPNIHLNNSQLKIITETSAVDRPITFYHKCNVKQSYYLTYT